jgi:hypothetical protein
LRGSGLGYGCFSEAHLESYFGFLGYVWIIGFVIDIRLDRPSTISSAFPSLDSPRTAFSISKYYTAGSKDFSLLGYERKTVTMLLVHLCFMVAVTLRVKV